MDDFVEEMVVGILVEDTSFFTSLDKIHDVVEIIRAVESISGFLPKTSHSFRSW